MKGICLIWSRGRHFSPSIPDRGPTGIWNLAHCISDPRAEISGILVMVRSFSATSRGTTYWFQYFCYHICSAQWQLNILVSNPFFPKSGTLPPLKPGCFNPTLFPGLFSAKERKGPSFPPFLSSAEKSPGNEVGFNRHVGWFGTRQSLDQYNVHEAFNHLLQFITPSTTVQAI